MARRKKIALGLFLSEWAENILSCDESAKNE
jgi:hypothetical protein